MSINNSQPVFNTHFFLQSISSTTIYYFNVYVVTLCDIFYLLKKMSQSGDVFTASCDVELDGCTIAWLLLLLSAMMHVMGYVYCTRPSDYFVLTISKNSKPLSIYICLVVWMLGIAI